MDWRPFLEGEAKQVSDASLLRCFLQLLELSMPSDTAAQESAREVQSTAVLAAASQGRDHRIIRNIVKGLERKQRNDEVPQGTQQSVQGVLAMASLDNNLEGATLLRRLLGRHDVAGSSSGLVHAFDMLRAQVFRQIIS